jgi:hypothetical protein
MMRIMPAAVLALFAANTFAVDPFTPAQCTGTVVNLKGDVTSKPASLNDPTAPTGCAEAASIGDQPYPPSGPFTCLRIDVSGTVKASGYSVLTSVQLFPESATPFCFLDVTRGCAVNPGGGPGPFPPTSAGLQGFTSQAALTGRVQGNKYQGTVHTKDTGYITADGFVGQVLLIVGGTGSFEGATGRVAVAGQEVGGSAIYTGHICIKP